ncbi:glucose-6-phosphate isomerase, cytosolic, partial [Olea europaea subsp. europaea]
INNDGKNVVPDVWQVLDKIRDFSKSVRSGACIVATGKVLKDVIAIGIGGSFSPSMERFLSIHTQWDGEEKYHCTN